MYKITTTLDLNCKIASLGAPRSAWVGPACAFSCNCFLNSKNMECKEF